LAEFVTGLRLEELSADLSALINGHRLEDHATMHLRFDNGARGLLWNTCVAIGNENGLSIRLFGTKGALEWRQERPNILEFVPLKQAKRTLTRGGPETGCATWDWERVPAGHPEGYQEAFANLYAEIGEAILAKETGIAPPEGGYLFPTVEDGARGMDFVFAALASSNNNAAFVKVSR
jgi:predicted dehydrogenase